MNLQIKLQQEHQELYKDLEVFLLDFTSLKNKRDDEFLIKITIKFLEYTKQLLDGHFQEEEKNFFPQILDSSPNYTEIIEKLLKDHQEIEAKFVELQSNLTEFQKSYLTNDLDYKKILLYPAYNLIATINHHALREDRDLFT